MKKCIFYLPMHVEKNVLDNLSNTWKDPLKGKRYLTSMFFRFLLTYEEILTKLQKIKQAKKSKN